VAKHESGELLIYDRACRAIAEARSVDDSRAGGRGGGIVGVLIDGTWRDGLAGLDAETFESQVASARKR
jgi:hypothetical protein